MDAHTFRRLEEIYHESAALPAGADRDAAIRAACAGNTELLASVYSLHAADERAGGQSIPPLEEVPPETLPRFGPYRAESVLGSGGAGTVYLGSRADGEFEQQVAIKVMRPSVSLPAQQGFSAERRILAKLKHPGIAQIYDSGVAPGGLHYIVLEYVDGQALEEYCQALRLPLRERIQLLLAVSEAVGYAHRNLVAHLDLKPSNILVGSDGVPKLVDFGTSRVLETRSMAVTQRLATPRYASPEQLRGGHAGIASDIFSLAVIWCEVLTGVWPFGDPASRLTGMRRAVDDTEPQLLKPIGDAEAQARGYPGAGELRKRIGGDLEAILRKALRFTPAERYQTVEDFADDVRRHLAGYPVRARPAPLRYRASRFMFRHRVALTAAAVVVACGILVAVLQIRTVRREAAARSALQSALMSEVAMLATQAYRVAAFDAATRDSIAHVAQSYEQLHSPSESGWYEYAAGLRGLAGDISFQRYRASLGEPRRAIAEYGSAIDYLERRGERRFQPVSGMPGDLSTALMVAYQNQADAMVETGRGYEALGRLMAVIPRFEDSGRPATQAELGAFWDKVADWLGGWETSCAGGATGRACGIPLPLRFALERAARYYATALRNEPSDLVRLHYAEVLIHQGDTRAAETLLRGMDARTDSTERALAAIAFGQGSYAAARAHLERGLALWDRNAERGKPGNYDRRVRALMVAELGRAKWRLGLRAEASGDTAWALQQLDGLAAAEEAPSDLYAAIAAQYLIAEPPALRDRQKAIAAARRAVQITDGQIAPFLVTLAHATGAPEDAAAAARAAWRQGEIVKGAVEGAARTDFERGQAEAARMAR